MLKNLLVILAILSLAACKAKVKTDEEFSNYNQPVEEIAQEEQFEEISDEEAAAALNEETQKEIEEVEVKDRVHFAYDSSELSDEAKDVLNVQAEWLKSDESINITIEGHCDERGTREYNIALGERRANAARDYLISQGIFEDRIKVISYGKERPAFFGDTAEVFAKNRRAVTVVE